MMLKMMINMILGGFIFVVVLVVNAFSYPTPTPTAPTRKDPLEYFLYEELAENTLIGNVAIDALLTYKYNSSILEILRYSFTNEDPLQHFFEIDPESSIVRTTKKIDRDTECPKDSACLIWLYVGVQPTAYSETIRILVEILDVNDHAPAFPEPEIDISIIESAPLGTSWGLPPATDEDSPELSVVDYRLLPQTDKFDIANDKTGNVRLVLKQRLDREIQSAHRLTVVASDGGIPPKSGSIIVNINVQDVNDNDPRFENSTYEFFVVENVPSGTALGRVSASDRDLGTNGLISYHMSNVSQSNYGDLFSIDISTGVIYQLKPMDFEIGSTYVLTIEARDSGSQSQPGHSTVIIRVQDLNDNVPHISLSTLGTQDNAMVSEAAAPGTIIAHISVSDQDGGDNGKIRCNLDNDYFSLMSLHQSQYQIVTSRRLDNVAEKEHNLTVVCHDLGTHPNVAMKMLYIRLVDENDHAPSFLRTDYQASLLENNDIGAEIVQVTAVDEDIGLFGTVRYSLNEEVQHLLSIDMNTGLITAKVVFDHEETPILDFHVIARDLALPPLTATANVRLNIIDVIDDVPTFVSRQYELGIFENEPVNSIVGEVKLTMPDMADIQFHLHERDGGISKFFLIHPRSGQIVTRTVLDRETKPVHYLEAVATFSGFPPMTGSASVTIYVADNNDNSPVFTWPNPDDNAVIISSQSPVNHIIRTVRAEDRDIGGNGKLTYSILSGDEDNLFHLHSSSGVLTIAKHLSHAHGRGYRLLIQARDHGYPQLNAIATLNIYIDNNMTFTGSATKIEEDVSPPVRAVVSNDHATIVVSVTAAVLVLIFIVLFTIMMCLVWRRLGPSVRKKHAKNCYENLIDKALAYVDRERGQPAGEENPPEPQNMTLFTNHRNSYIQRHQNNLASRNTANNQDYVTSHNTSPVNTRAIETHFDSNFFMEHSSNNAHQPDNSHIYDLVPGASRASQEYNDKETNLDKVRHAQLTAREVPNAFCQTVDEDDPPAYHACVGANYL